MRNIKILAIVGSLRKQSFNRQLAQMAQQMCSQEVAFEILDYADIPLMNQDIEFPAPESIRRVRDQVRQADAIWFFTPEYNHFFSGVLKNLIDWLSRPTGLDEAPLLSEKPAAISGISPSMSGTGLAQDHLVTLLSFLNMRIMNTPRLTIPNALEQVKDDVLVLDKSKPYLERQLKAFIAFIGE